jgi:hypothetical protein
MYIHESLTLLEKVLATQRERERERERGKPCVPTGINKGVSHSK